MRFLAAQCTPTVRRFPWHSQFVLMDAVVNAYARGAVGTTRRTDTHAADLAAIERLHRADIEATMTQDPNQLINLWSDDCVKLGVPGPAIVGKKGMHEVYEKFRADHPDFRVLKYAPEIQDVQVADGWAIEWVYYEAAFKMSAKDNPSIADKTGDPITAVSRSSAP